VNAARTMTLTSGTLTLSSAAFPTADLAALWDFDETTGTSAADPTGGHTGTLAGFPVDDSQWVSGKVGGAMDFDGADDQVDITGYTGVTGTQARTMAAWIKTTKGDATILSWGTDATGQKWVFRTQTGNGQAGAIRTEVSGGFNVGATDLRDDQWHHVVMVLPDDGTPNVDEMLVYVDGQLETPSASQATAINTASSLDVRIGNGHANRRFAGLLDQVGIWDRALTADEIATIYNGGNGLSSTDVGAVNQPGTGIVFSNTSTLFLDGAGPARLGGVSVAAGQTAMIDGTNNLTVSNLTVGNGSAIDVAAGGIETIELVVGGTLANGGTGIATLGNDLAGPIQVSLTLEQTATFDWTLGAGPQGHYLDVWGDVTIMEGAGPADGITINVLDGGGGSAGADAYLIAGVFNTFDLSKITVNLPGGWTSTGLALEHAAGPDTDVLMLKGLVGGFQGDTDGDDDVDEDDYDNLLAQFGGPGGVDSADFDGNGIVDMADFEVLRAFYGTGVPPAPEGDFGPATTPEPATMTLLAIGGLLVLRRRRRGSC